MKAFDKDIQRSSYSIRAHACEACASFGVRLNKAGGRECLNLNRQEVEDLLRDLRLILDESK